MRRGADLRAALTDGEDYELVFALAARTDREKFAATWHRAFPRTGLACLGRFVSEKALPPSAPNLADYRGYEHLTSGPIPPRRARR